MMPPKQRVIDHLDRLGVAYEAMDCDPDLADTAVFCAHYGVSLNVSANAIVVKSKRGEPKFGLVLVLATHKVVNRAIRKLLGTSKASFAPAEETKALTGMLIGGVTPFGLPEGAPLPIWIDRAVMDCDAVVIGGGSRDLKIRVAPSVIAALPNASVHDLAEPIE